jgi:hypothetical protein
MQDETELMSKKYKNLNKSEDSVAVYALAEQLEEFEGDEDKKKEYQKWFKGLSRDLQLQEAITVVGDLKQ